MGSVLDYVLTTDVESWSASAHQYHIDAASKIGSEAVPILASTHHVDIAFGLNHR